MITHYQRLLDRIDRPALEFRKLPVLFGSEALAGRRDDAIVTTKFGNRIMPDGSRLVPAFTTYLEAGCGFGGSCFPKDVQALMRTAGEYQYDFLTKAQLSVWNDEHPSPGVGETLYDRVSVPR